MSRPPAARDAVLDAFERIVVAEGERAATLEAVARAAGVSKGGLLYHFGGRQALVAGLLERLDQLVDEDVTAIHDAPEGAISYFIRASTDIRTPLDRAFIAAVRLAQGGDRAAVDAIEAAQDRWLQALGEHVTDPNVALAIALVGDGLYYQTSLQEEGGAEGIRTGLTRAQMDALIALFESLAAR